MVVYNVFLMKINEAPRLFLVSGSEQKFHALRECGGDIIEGWELEHRSCPVEVLECNHWKPSPLLFRDKAKQMWLALRETMHPNRIGLTNDVRGSMLISPGNSDRVNLTNHPDRDYLLSLKTEARMKELALFMRSFFGVVSENEPLLMRVETGNVLWAVGGLLGLITQRDYIHYPKNPIPSLEAAQNYLAYVETKNNDMGRKVTRASAGVEHVLMVKWFCETFGEPVRIETRSGELREIAQLGQGFTPEIVQIILALASKGARTESQVDLRPRVTSYIQ